MTHTEFYPVSFENHTVSVQKLDFNSVMSLNVPYGINTINIVVIPNGINRGAFFTFAAGVPQVHYYEIKDRLFTAWRFGEDETLTIERETTNNFALFRTVYAWLLLDLDKRIEELWSKS